ncbi:hypothetical protein NA57DRAFT_78847 [Rhizodiscina lignyota]|uniref:F-box domain-containing protein n=1 Tax=Rhizodiscina lignyota TaxID=1504668 RepID=A0A9P4IB93_9PEZI|nr:hypothetical protein NA57DRAFT_78847 [Rhizodiscina lignyota]
MLAIQNQQGWTFCPQVSSLVKAYNVSQLPTEILENIFLSIDNSKAGIRDLFRCKGVCTRWKDIFRDSVNVQGKLFLYPSEFAIVVAGDKGYDEIRSEPGVYNFDLDVLNGFRLVPRGTLLDEDSTLDVYINPLVAHHFVVPAKMPSTCLRLPSVSIKAHDVPNHITHGLPVHEDTLWREMYLTQPPISSILLVEEPRWRLQHEIVKVGWQLVNLKGVTLSDVEDLY